MWLPSGRWCWCSTTFTRQTSRRSCCCGLSPASLARAGCSSSVRSATSIRLSRSPLATTLTELTREPVTRTLTLTGLDEADVARLIELATPGGSAAELSATVHAETEGNPLFVGEIVRLLAAEGRLGEPATRPPRNPAERERGDRPPPAPSIGRVQPAAQPGLGAGPRVRSRGAGGSQRTRARPPSRIARRGASRRAS